MNQSQPPMEQQQAAARHGAVRRTVLVALAVVIAIYVGFILSGVLGGAPAR